jgi:hypothetical protein
LVSHSGFLLRSIQTRSNKAHTRPAGIAYKPSKAKRRLKNHPDKRFSPDQESRFWSGLYGWIKQFLVFFDRIAVGHSGDVIADSPLQAAFLH